MRAGEPRARYTTFEELLEKDGYLAYTNVGTSMMPLLRERRDIIIIHKKGSERCRRYDAVLYKRGDKYILHRVLRARKDDYVICGDHNIRREYGIRDEDILGVMTRVIRDGRSIFPTDWKYRVYVHLWCDLYPIRAAILWARAMAAGAARRVKRMLGRKGGGANG